MNMIYTRKYNIEYEIKMKDKDGKILNSLFEQEGLYLASTYDTRIIQDTQGLQTITHTDKMYGITLNNVKHGLTFEYQSDARKAQEQLIKVFPDGGIFPIDTIETKSEETDLMDMRGECILLTQWNTEEDRLETLDEDMTLGISWYPIRYLLEDDVELKATFYPKGSNTILSFEIKWESNKVARKDAIERRLVDRPLGLMALIQLKVENALRSQFDHDKVNNPTIDCKFESINFTSSECSPDIIQMVRDAKEQLKQQEEE